MKKIISIIIAVLLLVSCFGFSASASIMQEDRVMATNEEECELSKDAIITFSEDFKTLTVDNQTYSRFNTRNLYIETYLELENRLVYNNKTVEDIELFANLKGNVIDATIHYNDGSYLVCTFMDDRYIAEVNNIVNEKNKDSYIEFNLKEEKYFKVDTQKLKAKSVVIKTEDFYYESQTFSVYGLTSDNGIRIDKGRIHVLPDKVYYETNGSNDENLCEDGENWKLYEIEDKKLIEEINKKEKQYYKESEYGLFMNEEVLEKISIVFFVIFFVILPFAVMVASIVFAIRSKKPIYKKMYIITSIAAGVQTVIFVIGCLILFK